MGTPKEKKSCAVLLSVWFIFSPRGWLFFPSFSSTMGALRLAYSIMPKKKQLKCVTKNSTNSILKHTSFTYGHKDNSHLLPLKGSINFTKCWKQICLLKRCTISSTNCANVPGTVKEPLPHLPPALPALKHSGHTSPCCCYVPGIANRFAGTQCLPACLGYRPLLENDPAPGGAWLVSCSQLSVWGDSACQNFNSFFPLPKSQMTAFWEWKMHPAAYAGIQRAAGIADCI